MASKSVDSSTKRNKGWKTGLEDISADYHTYALERRDGTLRFYFDDQLTWEKSSIEDSFAELSRHMVLSLEGHLGMPVEEYLPGEFLVDYVRTYYDSDFAGVPEDGLYQIVNRQSKKALDIPNSEEVVQRSLYRKRQHQRERGESGSKETVHGQ